MTVVEAIRRLRPGPAAGEKRAKRAARSGALASGHPQIGLAALELARVDYLRGDRAGARLGAERALEILERAHGLDHANLIRPLNFRGVFAMTKGRLEDAESLLSRSVTLGERSLGANNGESDRR